MLESILLLEKSIGEYLCNLGADKCPLGDKTTAEKMIKYASPKLENLWLITIHHSKKRIRKPLLFTNGLQLPEIIQT